MCVLHDFYNSHSVASWYQKYQQLAKHIDKYGTKQNVTDHVGHCWRVYVVPHHWAELSTHKLRQAERKRPYITEGQKQLYMFRIDKKRWNV